MSNSTNWSKYAVCRWLSEKPNLIYTILYSDNCLVESVLSGPENHAFFDTDERTNLTVTWLLIRKLKRGDIATVSSSFLAAASRLASSLVNFSVVEVALYFNCVILVAVTVPVWISSAGFSHFRFNEGEEILGWPQIWPERKSIFWVSMAVASSSVVFPYVQSACLWGYLEGSCKLSKADPN